MKDMKEAIRLMENLYSVERMVSAMEKEPKHYGTEELLYSNEVSTSSPPMVQPWTYQPTLPLRFALVAW